MITIEVTQDDINNGIRGSEKCALNLACRRVFNERLEVVTNDSIELKDPDCFYVLPEIVQLYIDSYDGGIEVGPMSFSLSEEDLYIDTDEDDEIDSIDWSDDLDDYPEDIDWLDEDSDPDEQDTMQSPLDSKPS